MFFEQESKKAFTFKVVFCKKGFVRNDMLVAAPTESDMNEWIHAFRMH